MTATPAKFRKKPVEIEAMQWPDDGDVSYAAVCQRAAIHRWVWGNDGKTWVVSPSNNPQDVYVVVETLEGKMRISPGDWVIRGVKGEFYPCKPDVFAATYEAVAVAPEPADCPLAAPFRYCPGCVVSPCPIGMDRNR